ncbi:ribosomal L34 protein [Rutstroemia sp. NJR-2017a WRK4]|nr:ribosomal L34 protein [Rutstroemia sp. NJR-2017a WRK4]
MLCLRCSHSLRATSMRLATQSRPLLSRRTFTSITPLRPTISPSGFRPTQSALTPPRAATGGAALDLLPKISAHPALGATQVRCGPRNTFSPSHFVRKRRHGFLSRIRTRKGRATLQRRKSKKRGSLSH